MRFEQYRKKFGEQFLQLGFFRRVWRRPARGLRQLEHQQRHLHAHSRGLNQVRKSYNTDPWSSGEKYLTANIFCLFTWGGTFLVLATTLAKSNCHNQVFWGIYFQHGIQRWNNRPALQHGRVSSDHRDLDLDLHCDQVRRGHHLHRFRMGNHHWGWKPRPCSPEGHLKTWWLDMKIW